MYYFKSGKLLLKGLDLQFSEKNFINGESYTSLTVQSLMKYEKDLYVTVYEIPAFYQWGTPEDLTDFQYWESSFENYFRKRKALNVKNLIVPMAGLGKRFLKSTDVPKPFLKIDDRPIYLRASDGISGKKIFVGLDAHKQFIQSGDFVSLDKTPEGQSLTTLMGAEKVPKDQEVMVTACDHEFVIDESDFEKAKESADAIIFTVKGYPGSRRNPSSFAYVNTVSNEVDSRAVDPAYSVASVSCKETISETPEKDPLLVGTFWFRRNEILIKGIQDQVKKNLRANGELYLDLVFNCLIEAGFKVKICPLKSYINWGDPLALAEALYWYEVFGGHRLVKRGRFSGVIESGI